MSPVARRLYLASTPEAVARAVHFTEDAARGVGLPEEAIDRLALAVAEAVANAALHGNGLDPLRHVTVDWETEGEGVWVWVEDEGPGIPADRLASAALPVNPLSTSGRGLFLLRTLADAVHLREGGRRVGLLFTPRLD